VEEAEAAADGETDGEVQVDLDADSANAVAAEGEEMVPAVQDVDAVGAKASETGEDVAGTGKTVAAGVAYEELRQDRMAAAGGAAEAAVAAYVDAAPLADPQALGTDSQPGTRRDGLSVTLRPPPPNSPPSCLQAPRQ